MRICYYLDGEADVGDKLLRNRCRVLGTDHGGISIANFYEILLYSGLKQ